ncbi:MAG: hypothetical protein DHS20C18_01400 [Saprospiraceae bacterium]|nr:MAG: hypothetical protein DHS20C18_01400 [Saprospiraceae bacterium]
MNALKGLNTLLFLIIGSISLLAGGLKGYITDTNGKALEYATIFVQETGTGTTTNVEGYFEIRLDPGNYTFIFQYLGYETVVKKVAVGSLLKEFNVQLKEQVLDLETVEVFEGREDPAYTVMRKAIAKASYHRQQIDSYEAQVYMKGSGRLKKSPFFLRGAIKKEGIDSSIAFVSESVSKIEYHRPDIFKETVISIYTQGNDNSTSPNEYINSSFYQPDIADAISPLSPKAFGYYRFELGGYFVDRGYGVNKIRVIPRSRGENVFEGEIYIVEDQWSIHSLSLKTYKMGIEFNINQIYAPIEDKAWLPVSHKIDVEGSVLGFAFEYGYLATVSNYQIELNPELEADFQVVDETIEKELAQQLKQQKQEGKKSADITEKLTSGQELTRKDLRKLMKEYEKEERKEQEEPEVVMEREYKVDSLATKRDSSYWAEIRPVPLTLYEVRGYEREDSLAKVEVAKAEGDSLQMEIDNKRNKRKSAGLGFVSDLLFGTNFKLGEKQYFTYDSPLWRTRFNPVEGFNTHTRLTYTNNKNDHRFSLAAIPRYSFARDKFTGMGELKYRHGEKLKQSELLVQGGRYIFQYNEQNPISQIVNMYVNLIEERNYISLYEKDFVKADYKWKVKENWSLTAKGEWAKRYTLNNNTTQTWFNKDDRQYSPNVPLNDETIYPFPETEKAAVITIGVEGQPWQKYRIRNGEKSLIARSSPTISLTYRKGIKGLLESEVDYDMLDFTFKHAFKMGARGKIDFKANAGIFLNDNNVGFADYKHFPGNRVALVMADPVGSFRLLDYYRYSTKDKFASLHLHYQFRKFLFTQIPEVWLMGLKENVFVNYLATPSSKNYFEVGYSLDNIFRFFRLEAAVSFQDGKYQDFGVLIGVASNLDWISFD